jgi:hypothetical protein
LIGQQVEFVIGDVNSLGSLFGLLADAITPSFECGSDGINLLSDTPSVKLFWHTLGKRWLWMFSRFLGRFKQLKPPYKQGGGAQNAKIEFT